MQGEKDSVAVKIWLSLKTRGRSPARNTKVQLYVIAKMGSSKRIGWETRRKGGCYSFIPGLKASQYRKAELLKQEQLLPSEELEVLWLESHQVPCFC